jgi:hypothetical protein
MAMGKYGGSSKNLHSGSKSSNGFTTKFVTRFGRFVKILKDQWNY